MTLDKTKVENVLVEGINLWDYPDLCDSFIESADYDGKPMTEEQLEEINQDSEFVYNHAIEQVNDWDPT